MRRVIWLQTATVFWLCRGIISLSSSLYMGLVVLGRLKIHTAEPLVPELSVFEVEMAFKRSEDTNHQVLIKSRQN